jgi:four helix bundle protein
MAGARSHTEVIAWQLANELKLAVYALIEGGPIARHGDLREQLRRSASNAPRAIAEGFGRYLPDDFSRYLRYANGELKETFEALQDGYDRRCFTRDQVEPLQRLSKRASKASSRLIAYLKTAEAPGEPRRPRRAPRNPIPQPKERLNRLEPSEPREPPD